MWMSRSTCVDPSIAPTMLSVSPVVVGLALVLLVLPLGKAAELGADRVFVLQVGRVERPLTVPRRPWEVARVSFEIARRHRFVRELAELPAHVTAHVLPSGSTAEDDSALAYRDTRRVARRIEAAHDASAAYLEEHL